MLAARRAFAMLTASTALGLLLIGWLLGTSTSHSFYSGGSRGDLAIICAPVLFGPGPARGYPLDQEEYRNNDGEVRVRDAEDDRTGPACAGVRDQAIALSLLIAIPTTVFTVLAVLRRREYSLHREPISHDAAVKIAG